MPSTTANPGNEESGVNPDLIRYVVEGLRSYESHYDDLGQDFQDSIANLGRLLPFAERSLQQPDVQTSTGLSLMAKTVRMSAARLEMRASGTASGRASGTAYLELRASGSATGGLVDAAVQPVSREDFQALVESQRQLISIVADLPAQFRTPSTIDYLNLLIGVIGLVLVILTLAGVA